MGRDVVKTVVEHAESHTSDIVVDIICHGVLQFCGGRIGEEHDLTYELFLLRV